MNAILLIAFLIIVAVVFYTILATSKEPSKDETDYRANPPITRWRRHLEKPPHLAFGPARFDRRSDNARFSVRC